MFARFQDRNSQERNSEEVEVNLDLYTCPMTRQIIRHPVLANDGRRYELNYLLEYVNQGNIDSPLRAGLGGIYPVVYDPQWKELLDQFFPNHPDRFDDYEEEGMVAEINDKLEASLWPQRESVDENGIPIHVAIGRKVLLMFFMYFLFSISCVSIIKESFSNQFKRDDSFSIGFTYAAIGSMTLLLTYLESSLRIYNDNEYGVLGGIADRYYSLFKRPAPHVNPPNNYPFPDHRMHRGSNR